MTSGGLLWPGRRVLPGFFFALLMLAVYADPLFLRRNFTGRDLPTYQLPIEKAVHDAWARGRIPVWVETISGGRPLLPNPNAGAFYPARPLLALLSFPLAARLFPVFHWLVAGLGMMALLRSAAVSPAGAWVGAAAYVFSGVAVSLVFYSPYLVGMALLPWIVRVARQAATGRSGPILVLSLLLGIDLLAGEVFTIGLAIAACGIWLLAETPRAEWARGFGSVAVALLLGSLLAAPQILATALWIPETHRGVTGMSIEEAIYFSVSPLRLLEFVVPYPFGRTWWPGHESVWGQPVFHGKTMGLFATLYGGPLAVIALLASPARRRREAGTRFALWLFVGSITAAVLPSLIPASLYSRPAPIALRYPEKFSIAALFGLAFLAGSAVDWFRRAPVRPAGMLAVGAALTLLAAAAHGFPLAAGRIGVRLAGSPAAAAPIAAARLPAALTEAALLWMMTVVAIALLPARSLGARGGSLVLLTIVPLLATRRIALTAREEEVLSPTPFARFVARQDPEGRYRVLGESLYLPSSALEAAAVGSDVALTDLARRHWYEYEGALWGRGTVLNVDFDSGDLSRLESLRGVALRAATFTDSQDFFGGLSLAFGVRFRDQPPLAGYARVGGDLLQDWDRHARAYPDIRLAEKWRERPRAVEALAEIPSLSAGEVVLETGARRAGQARPGQVNVIERSPERLRLDVFSPDPTWLLVLRAYWSYRSVTVDGAETEVVPWQLAFSAVRIPAGHHRVAWQEAVPGADLSRWGPPVFLLSAAWVLSRGRRDPRKR